MKYLLYLVLLSSYSVAYSQQQLPQLLYIKDSSVAVTMIAPVGTYSMPVGILAKRFGNFWGAGLEIQHKTKTRWVYGGGIVFNFGNTTNEGNILRNIGTAGGPLVTQDGSLQQPLFFMRGTTFTSNIGYLHSFGEHSKNSGLFTTFSVGYIRHKILIDQQKYSFPSLQGNLINGYDRLTAGAVFKQFAGYLFADPKKYVNFYIGVELAQGFTKSLRGFNYDTALYDNKIRTDMYIGLKLGWYIPIYQSTTSDYFR